MKPTKTKPLGPFILNLYDDSTESYITVKNIVNEVEQRLYFNHNINVVKAYEIFDLAEVLFQLLRQIRIHKLAIEKTEKVLNFD